MSDHDGDRPAFPTLGDVSHNATWLTEHGLSAREHAAIQLRVPSSGQQWLDDMIREARRWDAAQAAMAAMISSGATANGGDLGAFCKLLAESSLAPADALLSALSARGKED